MQMPALSWRVVIAAASAWMLTSTAVAAQSSGDAELRIQVTDPSGAALVAARISITDAAGTTREASPDERGTVTIVSLAAGAAQLAVEAEAFESYRGAIGLKKGLNRISIRLPVAGLREEVVVREDTTDSRGNSFTTVLTEQEIAQLPDDPDELEQMLLEMAGPGAVLRVNGFRGGRLPPKSQIRQIRFRMNSYAAENHDAGGVGIDVITKPGMDGWRGMTNFGFRDESLNARNAFADGKDAEQYRRFGFEVSGPLVKSRTSFSFNSDGNLSYDSQTIVAALPDATVSEQVRQPLDVLNATARLQHALTPTQTLLVEYQRRADERRNLGVGNFDLQSRAYTRARDDHRVRLAVSGLIAPKIASELKVQFATEREQLSSSSDAPALIVVDAFSSGGAGQQMDSRARELEIENNLDVALGRAHAIRAGLQLEAEWYRNSQLRNGNGTFTFASLDAFEAGVPSSWRQRVGGSTIDFAQYELGLYVQDDITVHKRLSVSVGVRQELQNTLRDRWNVAPRLGFTWAPGKWTVRGGWGLFYDWYDASLHEQTLLVDGVNQQDLVILRPGFPDPFAGGSAEVLPPSVIRAQGLTMPFISQASVGAQRTFGSLRVQSSYMAQRGYDQLRSRNINAPARGGGRPDPSLGTVTAIESTGRLDVDRLHIGVNFAQPERRLFLNANYTLSQTLNHSDSPLQLPADSRDLEGEWGPSSQDARHRLFAMANIGLPRNFRFTVMSQFSSALPYTIISGLDTNGDAVTNDRPAGVRRNSERGAASWNVGTRLSKTFTFGPPRQDSGGPGGPQIRVRGGDEGRGSDQRGGGPGGGMMMMMANPDDGRYRIELYVQAYNVLNRANYTRFTGSLLSPFFGEPTAAAAPRRIEVGAMFGF